MEWIKVEMGRPEEAAIKAARVLSAGGVIVFPAERLYGIGADARDREAVLRVFSLKGRDPNTPLPVMVGDRAGAEEWVEVTGTAGPLIEAFWPGPLTLVLPLKRELPPEVVAGGDQLGIRVPGTELAREIARKIKGPVTATSSNPSGGRAGKSAQEAVSGLRGEVDLVLDAGELPGPPGSTVVRAEERSIEVLRPGIISREQLEQSLKGEISR